MRVFVRRWKCHAGYAVNKGRFGLYFVLFVIVCLVVAGLLLFESFVVPYVILMAEDQAETSVVLMIDRAIADCNELINLEYDDIISVVRQSDGEPVSVSARTVKLNKIRSQLSESMNKMFDEFGETVIKIPLGGLAGLRFLSGVGVMIPVKFVPFGTAYADFKSSVEGLDINRTYHKIYLEASATVSIFVPMHSETLTVKTQIPIAETVISGDVPDTYMNIDGLVNDERTD